MATGRLPGQSPGLQVVRWSKAPTAGTTTLSGLDDYSVGLTYTAGYESVYLNGVLLDRTTDYTATNGTTIVLATATVAGDIVNVFGTQISPVNGSVPTSTYTTKGDILAASAANTPVRLGVGTNTQLLAADSTTATGLKWTDAPLSGAVPLLTLEESARYITTTNTSAADLTATANTTYYVPIFLPTVSIDRIAVMSGASFTSAGNTRLGLYNASPTTGKPTTLVFDAGTVNVDANATDYAITISQSITANWYYLAVNRQGGTYNLNGTTFITGMNTVASTLTGATMKGYSEASITGALPATVGTLVANTTRNPIAGVRIV